MRKKFTVLALVLSMFFSVAFLVNLIIIHTTAKLSESNTTELTATVRGIEIEGEDTNKHCNIYTEEYGTKITTYFIRKISDISDINSLEKGQTLFFRVKNGSLDKFEEMPFIPIYSLRTETEEIISLSSYNEFFIDASFAPTIAGIVAILIFLLTSIHCVLLLKGVNVFRKKNMHKNKVYGSLMRITVYIISGGIYTFLFIKV